MLLVICSLIWLPPKARQTAYQKEQFDWLFEMLGHNVSAGFFKIKRGGKCQSRSLSAQSIQSGLSAQRPAEPANRTTALSLPAYVFTALCLHLFWRFILAFDMRSSPPPRQKGCRSGPENFLFPKWHLLCEKVRTSCFVACLLWLSKIKKKIIPRSTYVIQLAHYV